MANFLLVHGAWHGAWCWYKVVAELESRGHRVAAIDLPGHGVDKTPTAEVTLEAYAGRVGSALAAMDGPAVVVGHSMGGMVITEAAERYAEQVAGLIYLTAIVLRDGEAMTDNPVKASPREFMAGFAPAEDGLSIEFRRELIRDAFYADCSDADIALARACLVPQSALVMRTPIRATPENWGSIPRSYITCRDDRALTLQGQQEMLARVGIERVVEMASSHSPFFSQPALLADHLSDLAAAMR
ncbi:MAG: alpha/beta fold hydrolase [Pseudomonadales bacterium]